MKLITWNIQWGLGVDKRLDLARVVAQARAMADFDVLCLQEVADNFPEAEGGVPGNQFAELARLLPGYTAIEGPGVDVPDAQGARKRFGNMILSRYPVGRVLRHAAPWVTDGTRAMPRLVLEAVVSAPWGPLRVLTSHFEYYSSTQRAAQVETVRRAVREGWLRSRQAPVEGWGPFAPSAETASAIFVADTNMTVADPLYGRLQSPAEDGAPGLVDAWTALNPGVAHPMSFCLYERRYGEPHCCDFAFVTPDLRPRLRRVFYDTATQVSDHQPVLVELTDD